MTDLSDLSNLNFRYLLLARELGRQDPLAAEIQLGLDASIACRLADLSLETLQQVAQGGVLLFQARFPVAFWHDLTDAAARGAELETLHLRAAALAATR